MLRATLIAFTGRAGSGKTTAALALARHLNALRVEPAAAKLSFADPLREVCRQMFPDVPFEAFYGTQEEKVAELPGYPGWSGRRILQHVGTEGFRAIDPDVWVKAAERMIRHEAARSELVVLDDVRFPNEAQMIQDLGGKVYRIQRPVARLEGAAGAHASESHIDDLVVTQDVYNHADLRSFERDIITLLPRT